MIPIDKLPDLDWSDVARVQLAEQDGDALVGSSTVAYRIGEIAVAGLIYHNLLSPPWFWFALARNIRHGDLLDFRRLKNHIPIGALTGVDKDDERCVRFAKLYGFVPTQEEHRQGDKTYQIFRRV